MIEPENSGNDRVMPNKSKQSSPNPKEDIPKILEILRSLVLRSEGRPVSPEHAKEMNELLDRLLTDYKVPPLSGWR